MTKLHSDSFDTYQDSVSTTTLPSQIGTWTSQTGDIAVSNAYSRFGIGKGVQVSGQGTLKELYAPDASGRNTYFAAFATRSATNFSGNNSWYGAMQFYNGTLPQVTVGFYNDGVIRVYRGNIDGTLIATFTNAIASLTWEHWQIKVVIGSGTSGSIRLRKDGATTDTFAATGLNTLATGSAICDGYGLLSSLGFNTGIWFDDVLFWDDSPAGLPNDWIGDIRSYPLYARAAGSSTDFTPYAAPVTKNSSGSTGTFAAGTTRLFQFTGDFTGTLNTLGVTLGVALTGKLNVAIYSDSGANAPNALLATATELTNPPIGLNTLTLTSPLSVTVGTKYWVAVASDASVVMNYNSGANTGVSFAAAYGSAFPATAPAVTTNQFTLIQTVIQYVPLNWAAVNQQSYDGDSSYVYSYVVGATDYYQFDALPYTPAYVLMVNVKSIARKSDTNPRSLRNQLKSGAAVGVGSAFNLSSTYRTIETSYFTDPATALPWTKAAIDAIQAGTSVTA